VAQETPQRDRSVPDRAGEISRREQVLHRVIAPFLLFFVPDIPVGDRVLPERQIPFELDLAPADPPGVCLKVRAGVPHYRVDRPVRDKRTDGEECLPRDRVSDGYTLVK